MLPRFLPLLPPSNAAGVISIHMRLDKAAAMLLRQDNCSPVAFRLVQRLIREKSVRCAHFDSGSLAITARPAAHALQSSEVPVINWRTGLGARLLPSPLASACAAATAGDRGGMLAGLRAACGTPQAPCYADAVLQDTQQHGLLPDSLRRMWALGVAAPGTAPSGSSDAGQASGAAPSLPSWCPPHPLLACLPDIAFLRKPAGAASQGGTARGGVAPNLLQLAPWVLHQRSQLPAVRSAAGQATDAVHPPRLRVGHRLDAPVSGVVAMPTTRRGADALRKALQTTSSRTHGTNKGLDKTYFGLMEGGWASSRPPQGVLSTQEAAVGGGSVSAVTRYEYVGAVSMRGLHGECSLVKLQPVTGRKHQLRKHCAQLLGGALVGDVQYGAKSQPRWLAGVTGRAAICLHAHSLQWSGCNLPGADAAGAVGGVLRVQAPLPQTWVAAAAPGASQRLLQGVDA